MFSEELCVKHIKLHTLATCHDITSHATFAHLIIWYYVQPTAVHIGDVRVWLRHNPVHQSGIDD